MFERCFQTMIRLDVPGETAARVLHRKREDLRKALEESRERWRAANRVVSPQGVRGATRAVLDGLADEDIPFPDEAQGIGPSL